MVNKYDNPAEYNPIIKPISQYVSLPFEELAYALGNKQRGADQQVTDVQNNANALNMQTIREHEPSRNQFVQEYNNQFMQLLDSGIDPTSSEFVRQKKQILDKLAKDQRPGIYKRSIEAQKQQNEYNEGLRKQGKYGYYNDPYSKGFQGMDESGNPLEYQFKPYNPTEDRIEPVLSFFKNAKPSGSEREGFQLDQSGNIIGVKKGYEGVGQKFIENNSKNYLQPFLNSNAGRDFVSEYAHLGYGKDQIEQLALEHINELGQVFIHGNSKEGTDFKYAPEHVGAGLEEAAFNMQAPITYNPATANPFGGSKINLNLNRVEAEDGVYTKDENGVVRKTTTNPFGGAGTTTIVSPEEAKKIFGASEQESKQVADEVYQKWQDIYKQDWAKNYSKEKVVELYNKAVENSGNYVPRGKNFSANKSELVSKQLLGGTNTIQGLNGQPLELLGPDGGKQINFQELEKLVGEVKLAKVQERFLDHPTKPGGYVVSISDKKGKNYKVAVGADQETEAWFTNNVAPATQANLSGKDTEWKVGRNQFKTITVPKQDGSGFATKVITTSPAGTFENDYNDFVKQQHNIYDQAYKHMYSAGYNTTTENKKLDTEEE